MSTEGLCAEGRVRFVCSYRGTVDYTVGRRRFTAGYRHLDEQSNGPGDYDVWADYTVACEADKVALDAFLAVDAAELVKWCERNPVSSTGYRYTWHYSVTVDVRAWHLAVYGTEATDADLECVRSNIAASMREVTS